MIQYYDVNMTKYMYIYKMLLMKETLINSQGSRLVDDTETTTFKRLMEQNFVWKCKVI